MVKASASYIMVKMMAETAEGRGFKSPPGLHLLMQGLTGERGVQIQEPRYIRVVQYFERSGAEGEI